MEIDSIHRSLYIKIRKDRKTAHKEKFVKHHKIPTEDICLVYPTSEGEDENDDESSGPTSKIPSGTEEEESEDVKSIITISEEDAKLALILANQNKEHLFKKTFECRNEKTRKRMLELHERNMYRNVDCGGVQSYYVKIYVQDGYIFIMKREILEVTSRIMKRMLMKQSKDREITSLHFYEIRPDMMKQFCLYATYSYEFRYNFKPKYWLYENPYDPYNDYKATREKIGKQWEFEFPKFLTYDLYIMANLLMC